MGFTPYETDFIGSGLGLTELEGSVEGDSDEFGSGADDEGDEQSDLHRPIKDERGTDVGGEL